MFGRVNVGDAAVVAFEVQPRRGDNAFTFVQWHHRPGRFLGRRRETPTDLALELRTRTVSTVVVGQAALFTDRVLLDGIVNGARWCRRVGSSGHQRGRPGRPGRGKEAPPIDVRKHAFLALAFFFGAGREGAIFSRSHALHHSTGFGVISV